MGQLIDHAEAQPGDVVLNFCDPGFRFDEDERRTQTSRDHLIRLLAYVLYARRVFVPGRYLVAGGPFEEAVRLAPELLEDGILVPDLRQGIATFRDLVAAKGLGPEAEVRARFVDKHAKLVSVFDDRGQSARFHTRALGDLAPGGALDLLLSGHRRELALIGDRFATKSGSREEFVSVARDVLPSAAALFERWAAIRYYTTPMEFDSVRVRDLPHTAARLLAHARALAVVHFEDPTVAETLPDPMSEAAQRMSLTVPHFYSERDARRLVEATLAARSEVPEAQEKLARVIEQSRADALAGALNDALRTELLRERIIRDLSPRMRDQVVAGVKDAAVSTGIGLVVGALLGPFAPVVDLVKGAAEKTTEALERRRAAPWRMSYEHLSHHLDGEGG